MGQFSFVYTMKLNEVLFLVIVPGVQRMDAGIPSKMMMARGVEEEDDEVEVSGGEVSSRSLTTLDIVERGRGGETSTVLYRYALQVSKEITI